MDKEGRGELLRIQEPRFGTAGTLVRCYAVTEASVHDSQMIGEILDPDNTAAKVWADKAYRSGEIEEMLEELGYKSMIMRKGSHGAGS